MVNTMQQLPKFHETFILVLDILSDEAELDHKSIRIKVKEKFYSHLSNDLLSQTTSTGANTLLDRISWAISYLTMGGYLKRTKRAYYQITQKGLKAFNSNHLSLEELKNQKEYTEHQLIQVSKRDNATKKDDEKQEDETPFDLIDRGIEKINNEIKNQLLEKIKNMDPYEFENIILKLFKAMGYGDTIGTTKSHDGGIDGIINQDKLGLEKIYIQAKRFNDNKIRETEIRNFIGAMSGDTNKGIFVTTSTFDAKAIEKANLAHHKIKLIDKEELINLMFDYGIGLQTKNSIAIKEIDNDFFDN